MQIIFSTLTHQTTKASSVLSQKYVFFKRKVKKGKFFICHKKSCGSLLIIKNFNLPIEHWIKMFLLIGHPSVKVRKQMPFWSRAAFYFIF
jgi:hypothetical protein